MAKISNKLVTKQMQWHANMTEMNHLGASLHARPEVFESKMAQLFSSKRYFSDNSLTSTLVATGREKEIATSEWEWSLRTASTKPLVVVENVAPSITQPGSRRTNFKLKLSENWFVTGDSGFFRKGNSSMF